MSLTMLLPHLAVGFRPDLKPGAGASRYPARDLPRTASAAKAAARYPFLPGPTLRRRTQAYGTRSIN
jgi:hypothetical protein